MRSIILFEDEGFENLLPLLYWRSVFELRVGRKIIMDRTAQRLGLPVAGVWTRDWISKVAAQRCGAPANQPVQEGNVLVNGRWLCNRDEPIPTKPCVGILDGQVAYIVCDQRIADDISPRDLLENDRRGIVVKELTTEKASGDWIQYPWDLICHLSEQLCGDWEPGDAAIDSDVDSRVLGDRADQIHIGERTCIHPSAILDTTKGPIFISHDVTICSYSVIEGPAYIGPGSRVNPHAWLHGGNSFGPVCKIGGEVNGCVIQGYTNKQHNGFLGHAYVGNWINIGAGSNNSDLKNTYGSVRVPMNGKQVDTGLTFFGSVIADHVKIGINATIPTGAVIGLAASIATTKLLPKYIPSFSWIRNDQMISGDPLRALDVASAMMARRDVDLTDDEVELFTELSSIAKKFESSAPPEW